LPVHTPPLLGASASVSTPTPTTAVPAASTTAAAAPAATPPAPETPASALDQMESAKPVTLGEIINDELPPWA
jgi:hypothetical protein